MIERYLDGRYIQEFSAPIDHQGGSILVRLDDSTTGLQFTEKGVTISLRVSHDGSVASNVGDFRQILVREEGRGKKHIIDLRPNGQYARFFERPHFLGIPERGVAVGQFTTTELGRLGFTTGDPMKIPEVVMDPSCQVTKIVVVPRQQDLSFMDLDKLEPSNIIDEFMEGGRSVLMGRHIIEKGPRIDIAQAAGVLTS